jgi:hypothetical protein
MSSDKYGLGVSLEFLEAAHIPRLVKVLSESFDSELFKLVWKLVDDKYYDIFAEFIWNEQNSGLQHLNELRVTKSAQLKKADQLHKNHPNKPIFMKIQRIF